MSRSKRGAQSELNDRNWDAEEEPEERGEFRKADPDEIKRRVVKVGKRRSQVSSTSSVDGGSIFSGFSGFKTNTTAASPFLNASANAKSESEKSPAPPMFNIPAQNSPMVKAPFGTSTISEPKTTGFNFLSKPGSKDVTDNSSLPVEKPKPSIDFSSILSKKSTPGILSTTNSESQSFTSKRAPDSSTTDEDAAAKKVRMDTNMNSLIDQGKDFELKRQSVKYEQTLAALNRSVSKWISNHVAENACVDLTPVFDDYKKHLAKIDGDFKSVSQKVNGEAADKNAVEQSAAATVQHSDSAKPFTFGKSSSESTASAPFTFGNSASKTSQDSLKSTTEDSEKSSLPFGSSHNIPKSSVVGSAATNDSPKENSIDKSSPFKGFSFTKTEQNPEQINTSAPKSTPGFSFGNSDQSKSIGSFFKPLAKTEEASGNSSDAKSVFGKISSSEPSKAIGMNNAASTVAPTTAASGFSFGSLKPADSTTSCETGSKTPAFTSSFPGFTAPVRDTPQPFFSSTPKVDEPVKTTENNNISNITKTSTPFSGFNFKTDSTKSDSSPFGGFKFGAQTSSSTTTGTLGFSFSSSTPAPAPAATSDTNSSGFFSFKTADQKPAAFDAVQTSAETQNNGDADSEEPPKPEFKEVKEPDAYYSVRCKLFYKKDDKFQSKGVGVLHFKNNSGKKQLLMRADTNLGNVLLNILMDPSMPTTKLGKSNVSMVAVANPPMEDTCPSCKKKYPSPQESNKCEADCSPLPSTLLFKVKFESDADELLAKFKADPPDSAN